jgi:hypothetical protein
MLSEDDIRNAFLLPYLSVDRLKSNPTKFLRLLRHRAKHPLQDWMLFDLRQTKLGWENGMLSVDFVDRSVIMHGPRYGELATWKESEVHRWDAVGFPHA